jgi:signal transduction histidine kinase
MIDSELLIQWLRQMGHDMRAPLATLISTTDMLAGGIYDPLTPKQARAVSRLQRNQRRLLAIVDDFVTFVKAEAQQIEVKPLVIETAPQLELWRKHIEAAAVEKGLSLCVEQAAAVPKTVTADPVLLDRLVKALLWNAVAFTQQGSVALVSDWTTDRRWSLTVRDTGAGITAEQLPLVFEPFWRGEERPEVATAGAGLGLPMARALAQLMGGSLMLVTTSAQGSAFQALIPDRAIPN